MSLNVVGEQEILLGSPWTFFEAILVTTRCSSHFEIEADE